MLPNYTDVMLAHTTWSGLEQMLRILKRSDMPFAGVGRVSVPGRWTATSSYPGFPMYSSDDFYVMSSGLITMETTIDNENTTLAREFASTKVVLEWARNVLANRLAVSSASWASVFSQYASGTYTNSWMIFDTKAFTPGSEPRASTLLVVEEMPGHVRVSDQTLTLVNAGYWASYNVPADPLLFVISGQQALVDEYGGVTGPGAYFTLNHTSRANIFARDAPKVLDDASLKALIRYNDAVHDPLSSQACGTSPPYSYTNAIADRSDLNSRRGDYKIGGLGHGDSAAIDAKVGGRAGGAGAQ